MDVSTLNYLICQPLVVILLHVVSLSEATSCESIFETFVLYVQEVIPTNVYMYDE